MNFEKVPSLSEKVLRAKDTLLMTSSPQYEDVERLIA
jgi:hypothetical protein